MSALLRVEEANRALDAYLPTFNHLCSGQSGIELRRQCMVVVILNPTMKWDPSYENDPGHARFIREVVLVRRVIGDPTSENIERFSAIATDKAYLAWKWGESTRAMQITQRHRLTGKNTIFGGSAIVNGIVVGASGVQDFIDEAIAFGVAGLCSAYAAYRYTLLVASGVDADFLEDFPEYQASPTSSG